MRPYVCLMLLVLTACAQDTPDAERTYLDAARQAAAWIGTTTVETPHGPIWPADALKPEAVTTRLGDGVAGIVLFFLELHRATGDARALREAQRGAAYLLATLPDTLDADSYHPAATLYNSVPGAGVALYAVYRATNEPRYRDGALRSVDLVHAYARQHDGAEGWPPYNDVLNGNAGTGLFLLYAAREMGHTASRDLALRLGRLSLDRALPEQGGLTWKLHEDRDFILPNFSHGAAGIGYFLATLYQETGQDAFLDGARAAATYLRAIARTEDEGLLVPYGWPLPEWEDYYDIGWAHGPAGTARLFFQLGQITGEDVWLDLVHASARGIRQSGVPGSPTPGFGDDPFKPDLRFGTASVALFYLDLYQATGETTYLTEARRLTDHLLDRATRDADGLRWEAPRYDFFEHGGEQAAFTGYFYGAAGYGLLLLRLDAALHDTRHKINLPDDPFEGLPRTAGPPARNQPALVYDAARDRTVLFGGWGAAGPLGDTWEWDGTRWMRTAALGPPARGSHALAYLKRQGVVVLFGGVGPDRERLDDTWTWDGRHWTQVAASGPSARSSHALAYDERRDQVVLFGGTDATGRLGDTWVWKDGVWTPVDTTGPSPRRHPIMTYDAARDVVLLFGGSDASGRQGDTWTWDGRHWTLRRTPGPSARDHHAMAYDAHRQAAVLFGGWDGSYLGDTWAWDGHRWRPTATTGPSLRGGKPGMAYDSRRRKVMLYGGGNDRPRLHDLWHWDGARWHRSEAPPTQGAGV